MAAEFLERLFPHNSRRRLYAGAVKKIIKNPVLFFRIFNKTAWNKLVFYNGTLEPSEIEKRMDRKLAEYGGKKVAGQDNPQCGKYIEYLFGGNNTRDKSFRDISTPALVENGTKAIAFYLPQYHPIPENDAWWGKGFTEWVNVTRGVPQFAGHHQPKLPGELGYYDLRIADVRRRQVELAKQYGIHGFCFHYYWFGGKTFLEMPLEEFAADDAVDFPFCISWANENWTRTWDGLENDVLIRQKHSPQDDIDFISRVSGYMKHRNYIKIGAKPLLCVYRPALLPDAKATAKRWREWCRENGIGEIYLALTHTFNHADPDSIGFDAAIEFAPNTFPLKDITQEVKPANPGYSGQVFDYRDAVHFAADYKKPHYKKFRGICPGWDNDCRKPGRGITLANGSPEAYREWMEVLRKFTLENFTGDERLIFINAWNEWAEGAYLEPDRKYGYAYLEATAQGLFEEGGFICLNEDGKEHKIHGDAIRKENETAVIAHAFYPEVWAEMEKYLDNLTGGFDLYVSIPEGAGIDRGKVLKKFGKARIYTCPNRGRDMAPFLRVLSLIDGLGYRYGMKIHTKKSEHRKDGQTWRRELYDALAGRPGIDGDMKRIFDADDKTAIICPGTHIVPSTYYWGGNAAAVKRLAGIAGTGYKGEAFDFAAGSMFWFKPDFFKPLNAMKILNCDFEEESGQVDGTLAHALERFFGLLAVKTGYHIASTDGKTGGAGVSYRFARASRSDDEESQRK